MSALPHVPVFMDRTWLSLVSVKTAVDLQLLPTRCAIIQLAMNWLRRVSAVLLGISSDVALFSSRNVILLWKVLVWLRVIGILTKACSFASWKILT